MQSAQPGPELHYSFEVDYKYVKSRPYKCWFCVFYFQLSQKYSSKYFMTKNAMQQAGTKEN